MLRRLPLRSVVPAAILAVFIIATFARLQNYGPASAVRHLIHSIRTRNVKELERSLDEPNDPSFARMAGYVAFWSQNAVQISINQVPSPNGEATRIWAYFRTADNRINTVPFITVQTPSGWKVDANATLNYWIMIQAAKG